MYWTSLDTWIVAAGVLSALSCALLGNFLVLRRMSMMGDAISHAVLPGIATAFLLTSSRASLQMFIGAAVVGVLTAVFTEWVRKYGRVDEGASMGVVFTSLFAVGLIILVRAADSVDLDPDCVLYGAVELVPLDTIGWQGVRMPRAVAVLSATLVVNLLFVVLFFKELKVSSFDEDLAASMGINPSLMHYALMTLVAVTAVASFESVGSILVIAMLIVPAATAHLLTDRLWSMLMVSAAVAILSAVLGHVAAITVPGWWGYTDTTTAGMMAVVAGCILLLAMVVAPRHGIVSKLVHRTLLSLRITREDVLGLLYRLEEFARGERATPPTAMMLRTAVPVGHVNRWLALAGLLHDGKVRRDNGEYTLTDRGREEARNLVRAHRLWESYLHKHLALPIDHLHLPAEQLEHVTDSEMRRRLMERMNRPIRDPHGRTIPSDPNGQNR